MARLGVELHQALISARRGRDTHARRAQDVNAWQQLLADIVFRERLSISESFCVQPPFVRLSTVICSTLAAVDGAFAICHVDQRIDEHRRQPPRSSGMAHPRFDHANERKDERETTPFAGLDGM